MLEAESGLARVGPHDLPCLAPSSEELLRVCGHPGTAQPTAGAGECAALLGHHRGALVRGGCRVSTSWGHGKWAAGCPPTGGMGRCGVSIGLGGPALTCLLRSCVDATTFLYFSFFAPLIYVAFLRGFFG